MALLKETNLCPEVSKNIHEESFHVKVGSRKSQLALIQTNSVVDCLKYIFPERLFQVITMSTTGDNILDKALSKIGEKSLFTKELEIALDNKAVDIVVHSLKDLPTTLPPGMVIGGVGRRENPHDAVILHPKYETLNGKASSLAVLPHGCVIGTSSLRRIAQLSRRHPHLKFESVRGNLNTRLRKLDEGNTYDALILAAAGVKRMGWAHRISYILSPDDCMHAVGQGALAIECRQNDQRTIDMLSKLTDKDTALCCIAERSFMRTLEGGCSVPVAVCSHIDGSQLKLKGGVFNLDGSKCIINNMECNIGNIDGICVQGKEANAYEDFCGIVIPHIPNAILQAVEELGKKLAQCLLEAGAAPILNEARKQNEAL